MWGLPPPRPLVGWAFPRFWGFAPCPLRDQALSRSSSPEAARVPSWGCLLSRLGPCLLGWALLDPGGRPAAGVRRPAFLFRPPSMSSGLGAVFWSLSVRRRGSRRVVAALTVDVPRRSPRAAAEPSPYRSLRPTHNQPVSIDNDPAAALGRPPGMHKPPTPEDRRPVAVLDYLASTRTSATSTH